MSSQMLVLGAIGALVLSLLSFQNWRIAIKVALVVVLYEGALRKWAFPGAADLIYFVKDFILLGAYLRFYTENQTRLKEQWPLLPISLFTVCIGLIFLQVLNPNAGSPLASLLGLRGYVFYLPLAFLLPHLFRNMVELKRDLAVYLLLTIPIGLLGIVQFKSGAFSVVNTYASGTEDWGVSTFGVAENVRITGTFSYLSGHVVFVITLFALNLAALSMEKVPYRMILTFVCLPLLVAGSFMSGARAAVLAQGFIAIGFVLGTGFTATPNVRKSLGMLAMAGIGIAVSIQLFFADAAEKSMARMNGASDSVRNRTIEQPIEHLVGAWEKSGGIGCGLGTTSPAVESLRRRINLPQPYFHPGYYDNELAQAMAEMGIVGFIAWYTIRIAVAVVLWRSYTMSMEPTLKLLALSAFLTYMPFMLISLVLNHVACVLVWSMVGLGLTAILHTQAAQKEIHRIQSLGRRRSLELR